MQTDIAFGLQLLIETYKSFVFASGSNPIKANSRLQVLMFAGEVKKSVSRVGSLRPPWVHSCTCPDCHESKLQTGVRLLEQDVIDFTAEKRFDLYYQAPWVAGTQMLEMLWQATDYGLLLGLEYVDSVLHLYNCLRQVGALSKESIILERLCNLLEQAVFERPRPDRKFYARFVVQRGGRLQLDRRRMHRKKQAQRYDVLEGGDYPFHGRDRTWRMTLLDSITKDLLTIMPQSHFYALNAARFDFQQPCSVFAWTRFYGTGKGETTIEENEFKDVVTQMHAGSFAETLDRMKRNVGPELEGKFPIARINWLEVYLTCADILEKIAIAKLQEPAMPIVVEDPENIARYGVGFCGRAC